MTKRILGLGKVAVERVRVGGGDEKDVFDMMCLIFRFMRTVLLRLSVKPSVSQKHARISMCTRELY